MGPLGRRMTSNFQYLGKHPAKNFGLILMILGKGWLHISIIIFSSMAGSDNQMSNDAFLAKNILFWIDVGMIRWLSFLFIESGSSCTINTREYSLWNFLESRVNLSEISRIILLPSGYHFGDAAFAPLSMKIVNLLECSIGNLCWFFPSGGVFLNLNP